MAKKAKKTKGKAKTGKAGPARREERRRGRRAVRWPGLRQESSQEPVSERAGCRGARRGRRCASTKSSPATRFPSSPICTAASTRRASACSRAGASGSGASIPVSCPISSPRRSKCATATGRSAPIPKDLQDRRVELTGPVDRKMVINALNSGADVYMADFEDACSPTWANLIEGQINLKDYWAGKLTYVEPQTGKRYEPGKERATLDRAAARLAPQRRARDRRQRAGIRRAVRFRALSVPQLEAFRTGQDRRLFLSAQDREPSRSAAVERGVPARAAKARACRRARSRRRC